MAFAFDCRGCTPTTEMLLPKKSTSVALRIHLPVSLIGCGVLVLLRLKILVRDDCDISLCVQV